jgi:murein DD-endopeptidase MepM/ murein hydrolase activator NlpD
VAASPCPESGLNEGNRHDVQQQPPHRRRGSRQARTARRRAAPSNPHPRGVVVTGRVLTYLAVATTAAILMCSGLITALLTSGGAGASTGCALPASPSTTVSAPALTRTPPTGGFPTIGAWDGQQATNAAIIITVGAQMGIPPRGWVIAVATAMQESSLRNLPGGDLDSVGLFQQRPSQGWGTREQLTDPNYAATRFYTRLLQVPHWPALTLTDAAQAVQLSATAQAYQNRETDADRLVGAVAGLTGALPDCLAAIGPQGWTQPVHGPVMSGFRTPERPNHLGVDLAAPKGTPIRAAAAGTVTVVACNATTPDGIDWGCDRDGSEAVNGCGWYVDILHSDNVLTRYCHQLVHPAVTVGQHVDAGQIIGVSGTSGNSSGPHLHFEVRLGGDGTTAVDPVGWMSSHSAALQ